MSRRTQDPIRLRSDFGYRAFTFFGRAFDPVLLSSLLPYHGPSTPVLGPVWASPLSLAATQGITVVFSSSGYLDVSVRRVPLLQAMYSPADDSSCLLPGSPIRHLRFFASLQLHGAFRSLARPSSVSSGQAFAVRPSLLNQWFSCVSRCSFSRTVFYCFLSLSYNLRFRPFLLCLFFLVAQFSKIDHSEKSLTSQN